MKNDWTPEELPGLLLWISFNSSQEFPLDESFKGQCSSGEINVTAKGSMADKTFVYVGEEKVHLK